jgi:hypothetical protein
MKTSTNPTNRRIYRNHFLIAPFLIRKEEDKSETLNEPASSRLQSIKFKNPLKLKKMRTFAKSPIGLFILLIGGLLLPSCEEGCINPAACNYNPNAVKDDGSCIFSCSYESALIPTETECSEGDKIFFELEADLTLQVFNEIEDSPHFGEPVVSINLQKEKYKTCHNGTYEYDGLAQDVIGFRNVTNRTISFEYTITQTTDEGNKAEYHDQINELAPGRAVIIETEENIFPLLDHTPTKVKLSKVHYHR